jgi:hypothetical protein
MEWLEDLLNQEGRPMFITYAEHEKRIKTSAAENAGLMKSD